MVLVVLVLGIACGFLEWLSDEDGPLGGRFPTLVHRGQVIAAGVAATILVLFVLLLLHQVVRL